MSEYNEVYTNLIRDTLNWKQGRASLLTDDVKPLILSRIFDGTKYDKRITELWKQLKFLARFLMQDVLQGQWVEMQQLCLELIDRQGKERRATHLAQRPHIFPCWTCDVQPPSLRRLSLARIAPRR